MRETDRVQDLNRRMQVAYDGIVDIFASRNAEMPPRLVELGLRFVQSLPLTGPVLDAGCGVGRDLTWLNAQGCSCIGLDLSAGMLRKARKIASVAMVQADLRHLPFGPNQVAGVWCTAALLHLPRADWLPALQEIRRAMTTDAPLLLAVQEGAGEQWESGRYATEERLFTRCSETELEQLVVQCGYRIQASHRSAGGVPTWLTVLALAALPTDS